MIRLAPPVVLLALALAGCDSKPAERAAEPVASDAASPVASAAPAPTAAVALLEGPYAPRDECAGLPGWQAFHSALEAAIKARDAKALAALANPTIKLDFGGGSGRGELVRRLQDKAAKPSLWRELEQIAALGCGFDKTSGIAAMPWFFQQDLSPEDPFEVMLAAGPDVPLRGRPDPSAPLTANLSWILVKPLDQDRGQAFREVAVVGKQARGFIAAERLRSPLAHRLIATRQGDGWQIDALVAGD